jgi:hypothetical protein
MKYFMNKYFPFLPLPKLGYALWKIVQFFDTGKFSFKMAV